jgi:Uri superfamily endonuclease
VGRLGRCVFPAGDYAYVGSAFGPGGIAARAAHHLAVSARPHWHLDHLRPHGIPLALWFTTDTRPLEHLWAAALSGIRGAAIPCPGFGSSDCGCPGHLIHFTRMPTVATFRRHAPRLGRRAAASCRLQLKRPKETG